MRLAKASALINTTWQRLIRVAWVPSNQPIVSKPPSLAPAVPQSWAQYCMNLTSRHLSPECFTFELRIRWVTRLNHIQRLSCCWFATSFQYLVCPHRWWTGRGHCCMYCCFLWKERKKTFEWSPMTYSFDNKETWGGDSAVIRHLRPDGLFGSDDRVASEKWTMCFKMLHGPVLSIFNMYHSIMTIMKKSGAGGRHKWKWHKKTEHAVFSLFFMTANTKAWREALIEATEWHAQSNWISSAVSSNLIWPALWRMTGERNTFSCLPLPLGVPHTHSAPQTCRFHATTGQHLLHGLPLLTAYTASSLLLSSSSAPPGNPCYTASAHSVPSSAAPDQPSYLFLPHTSLTLNWDL